MYVELGLFGINGLMSHRVIHTFQASHSDFFTVKSTNCTFLLE